MARVLYDTPSDYPLSQGGACSEDVSVWIERYLDALVSKSPQTKRAYKTALEGWLSYVRRYDGEVILEGIGAAFLNNYLLELIEALALKDLQKDEMTQEEYEAILEANSGDLGRNHININIPYRYEKTLSQRQTILKQLLSFISANNRDGHDFTRLFKSLCAVRVQQRRTEYLHSDEMKRLIEASLKWPHIYQEHLLTCKPLSGFRAWRDSLLILLYATTGMRASEARAIRIGDIAPVEGKEGRYYALQIHSGKGGKARVAIAPFETLHAHIEQMRRYLGEEGYIAARSPQINEPISYSSIYVATKPIFALCQIEKSGFHNFRRGYATEQIKNGRSITKLAMQLGHSSTDTTFKSYVKNSAEVLVEGEVGW